MIFEYFDFAFGFVKFSVYKIFNFNRLNVKGIQKFSFHTNFCIKKNSKINFKSNCRTRRNCTFYCYDGATINIGKNVFFNEGNIVSAREKITIGDNCNFGNNVSIYDNDHDYKHDLNKYLTSKIVIGNNVWIGAGSIILRGVSIGDNCVIAAGTIVNKNIPNNTIVYQKRTTVLNDIYECTRNDENKEKEYAKN